jgi:hypothetical protein
MSIADVKEYLQITTTDATQDALIGTLYDAAIEGIGNFINASFSITEFVRVFPGGLQYLNVKNKPLVAVTDIHYLPSNTIIDLSEISIIGNNIYLASGLRYLPELVHATYTAGYASFSAAPDSIKAAVYLITSRLWENRASYASTGSPMSSVVFKNVYEARSDLIFLLREFFNDS